MILHVITLVAEATAAVAAMPGMNHMKSPMEMQQSKMSVLFTSLTVKFFLFIYLFILCQLH